MQELGAKEPRNWRGRQRAASSGAGGRRPQATGAVGSGSHAGRTCSCSVTITCGSGIASVANARGTRRGGAPKAARRPAPAPKQRSMLALEQWTETVSGSYRVIFTALRDTTGAASTRRQRCRRPAGGAPCSLRSAAFPWPPACCPEASSTPCDGLNTPTEGMQHMCRSVPCLQGSSSSSGRWRRCAVAAGATLSSCSAAHPL